MQVNVVNGGDVAVAALLYRPPDQNLLDYLGSKMNQIIDATYDKCSQYVNNLTSMYNKFNSSSAIQAAKMLMYDIHSNTSELIIQRFDSIESYNPNLLMQGYIMAHPEVSKLYKQNMCNGFASTYIDTEPNTYGEDRIDYQNVMDGVLQYDSDGNGIIKYYSNDSDTELDPLDKFAILETWDLVASIIANGKDPTDLES